MKLGKSLIRVACLTTFIIIMGSCTKSKVRTVCHNFIAQTVALGDLSIEYPKKNTIFPIDFQSPTFHWTDSSRTSTGWIACISNPSGDVLAECFVTFPEWKPDSMKWESLKRTHINDTLQICVVGYNKKNNQYTGSKSYFLISKDSVGADIFFRAVTLPFSYAVRNVHTIEWYLGSVRGEAPRKILDHMPVCANCHSFSSNGSTLAMDVDYGNDKGSYALLRARDTASITPEDIITWGNFKKDEGEPTFGLLSQISPSGKYVLSTVKDLSVFAAVDDNLAYSQLFFPIKGIIGIYNVESMEFSELQGANNPVYVQSNPIWSPDNQKVLFARTNVYINEKVRKYGNALLNINDVKEFKDGKKEFKYDLYSVNFNNGSGGIPQALPDASNNGKSNYFPKFSPDGKWIVFCQAENFMLLQPDSKLYIMKADGTGARLMNCNMNQMNSWHSWSPNGRWMVFSSKEESLYTRLYLTHIDENGNDSPPVLLENLVFDKRAANIPEFFPGNASEFLKIKDDFSNTAPYFSRLATDNIKNRYYLQAEKNLDLAISLDPDYIDSYLLKILLNSILQQVNSKTEKAEKAKALTIVDGLLSGTGEPVEILFLQASLLSAAGRQNEAEETLNSIIAKSPSFYRAYDLLATIYKKKNEPEQAIRNYKKMISLVPFNEFEINQLISKIYITNKQYENALMLLEQMEKKYPDSDEIHENFCSIAILKKDMKTARNEIKILLDKDSTNYKYYLMNSDISEIAGEQVKAKMDRDKAYQLLLSKIGHNMEDIPLYFEQAEMLQQKKDQNGALAIYEYILKKLPDNYMALKEKARIMLKLQHWQEAINLYENLLTLYSPEEEFYNNTAIAYIKLGNYEEALKFFSNTLSLDPGNIDALYNRSKLYNLLGNPQQAEKDMNTIRQFLKTRKNLTEEEKQLLNS